MSSHFCEQHGYFAEPYCHKCVEVATLIQEHTAQLIVPPAPGAICNCMLFGNYAQRNDEPPVCMRCGRAVARA